MATHTVAITGYGAWLVSEPGTEAFWATVTARKRGPGGADAPTVTVGRLFKHVLAETLDHSGLRGRSLEQKKIRMIIGGPINELAAPIRFLIEVCHVITSAEEHIAPASPALAALLLRRGTEAVFKCDADIAIVALVDPVENGGAGAVLIVFEREADAFLEEVQIAAKFKFSIGQPVSSLSSDYLGFYGPRELWEKVREHTSKPVSINCFPPASILDMPECTEGPLRHPMAPLLKAVLATERGVFPVTVTPNPLPQGFRFSSAARPWFASNLEGTRSATVVLGMENGPIFCSLQKTGAPQVVAFKTEGPDLYVFSAEDAQTLAEQLESAARQPSSELFHPVRLATKNPLPWRAAIVAENRPILAEHAAMLAQRIRREPNAGAMIQQQVFFSGPPCPFGQEKLVLMFPGHASQFLQMNRDLLFRFPAFRYWVEKWNNLETGTGQRPLAEWVYPDETVWSEAERRESHERLLTLENGGQAGFVNSLAMFRLLEHLDVKPDCIVGYSNGEHTALVASGTTHNDLAVLQIMRQLKKRMLTEAAVKSFPRGRMLAVTTSDRRELVGLLQEMDQQAFLALDNCPRQMIVFATENNVLEVTRRIQRAGASVLQLQMDRPYHTPLFEQASAKFREIYQALEISSQAYIPVYSSVTAAPLPADREGVLEVVCRLWQSPVLFRQTTERLYADGVRIFIEAGPGAKLAGFVADTLRGKSHWTCSTSTEIRPAVAQFLGTLGLLFVRNRWNPRRLYSAIPPLLPTIVETSTVSSRQTPPVASASLSNCMPAFRSHQARSRLVEMHLSLMSEFLDSQLRVANNVGIKIRDRGRLPMENPLPEAQPTVTAVDYLFNPRCEGATRIWECEFDVRRHSFLRDHAWGGKISERRSHLTPLRFVPLAYSLEIALQASLALAGGRPFPVQFTNTRAWRWMTAETGQVQLKVAVEPMTPELHERFACRVRIENPSKDSPRMTMFDTEVRFLRSIGESAPSIGPLTPRPATWGAADFNQILLFHGETLQLIHRIVACESDRIEVELREDPGLRRNPAALPVGLLDAMGQIGGFWLMETQQQQAYGAFPVHIHDLAVYAAPTPGEKYVCRAAFTRNQRDVQGELELTDSAGKLAIKIRRFGIRIFQFSFRFLTTIHWQRAEFEFSSRAREVNVPGIILRMINLNEHPYLEEGDMWIRCLAFVTLGAAERQFWLEMKGSQARKIEWLLGRIAAKDALREWARRKRRRTFFPADIEILPDSRGLPRVVCPEFNCLGPEPRVSIAHSGGIAVAVVSGETESLGVDFECLNRPRNEDLLQTAFTPREQSLIGNTGQLLAGWVCKEAAAKAAGTGLGGNPRAWQVQSIHGNCWTIAGPEGMYAVHLQRLMAGWLGIARQTNGPSALQANLDTRPSSDRNVKTTS